MAGQPGERPATAEIGAELIGLMLPDADLELVRLMLRSAVNDSSDHDGRQGGDSEPRAALLREYAELIALIRAAGIDHAELGVILELNPEIPSLGDDTSHPPVR
jgi:hypothetical protein